MQFFLILWQSAVTSATTNIQLYSVLHPLHITPLLFDFNDLTFSSTHKFLRRNSAFWGGDLFVNFHNISLYIQIDRTPVAYHVGLCFCLVVLQVHSFAKSHLLHSHVACVTAVFDWARSKVVQTELRNPVQQFMICVPWPVT